MAWEGDSYLTMPEGDGDLTAWGDVSDRTPARGRQRSHGARGASDFTARGDISDRTEAFARRRGGSQRSHGARGVSDFTVRWDVSDLTAARGCQRSHGARGVSDFTARGDVLNLNDRLVLMKKNKLKHTERTEWMSGNPMIITGLYGKHINKYNNNAWRYLMRYRGNRGWGVSETRRRHSKDDSELFASRRGR